MPRNGIVQLEGGWRLREERGEPQASRDGKVWSTIQQTKMGILWSLAHEVLRLNAELRLLKEKG